jgi:antitoxin component YwqK of YwqJK toxin-antitoxin module
MQKVEKIDFNGYKSEYYVNKEGEIHGIYKTWRNDGTLEGEHEYKNGNLDGKYVKWYVCGQKYYELSYKNCKKEGIFKQWDYNGIIRMEGEYKDGLMIGIWKEWHRTGQIWEISTYDKGVKDGKTEWWNGNCSGVNYYKNGKLNGESKAFEGSKLVIWTYQKRSLSEPPNNEINISLCYKGWKVLTKLIDNKKKRRIMKHMIENKDKLYSLQNDNIVFVMIMEYIGFDDMKLILEKLSSPNSFFRPQDEKRN